jgi:3-deoxy-D-manno-octulosonate 8-phosphate phosphatase (KDO 8-P phosphatase)
MTSSIEQLAARIQAIVFDVDGVLTRGDIIYGPDGEWKVFNAHDGHGFALARKAGIRLILLSGRASDAVKRRAKELKVDVLAEGVEDKADALRQILEKSGLNADQVCYVGDDLVDLPAMRMVGLPAAVANAVDAVKQAAALVTERRGGEGAAREVIDFVLKVKGY